jgi:hypothetical protein
MTESIFEWVGENLASTLFSQAGTFASAQVLDALGLSLSQDQAILNKLAAIDGKLNVILNEVNRLSLQIGELAQQLNLSTLKLQEIIEAVNISPSLTKIEVAYRGSISEGSDPLMPKTLTAAAKTKRTRPKPVPATSLFELIRRRDKGAELDQEVLDQFADDILREWDIVTRIFEIRKALVGDRLTSKKGLLWDWTEVYTAEMNDRAMSSKLHSYYGLLERNFLYYVGIQLQGVFLVTSAKSRGTELGEVSDEAAAFLKDDYRPSLEAQVNRFLECAERLAMHQCHFRSPGPRPSGHSRLDGGRDEEFLGVPAEVTTMLLRSQVVATLLLRSFKIPAQERTADGIFVHLFCREDQLVNNGGPALAPWGEVNNIGVSLPGAGVEVPVWGTSDDNYPTLALPSQSAQIRIVRYFWPYSSNFDTKAPLNESFYPWLDTRRYVDVDTFRSYPFDQRGSWPAGSTIANVAHIADFNRARTRIPRATVPTKWVIGDIAGERNRAKVTKELKAADHPILEASDPETRLHARLEVEDDQEDLYRANITSWSLVTPLFKYEGREDALKRVLKLHLSLSATTERPGTWINGSNMAGRLLMTVKGPGVEVRLFDSDTFENGKLNYWDKQSGLVSDRIDQELSFDVPVGVNTRGMRWFDLTVEMSVRHQNRNGIGGSTRTHASVAFTIRDLSFYWV